MHRTRPNVVHHILWVRFRAALTCFTCRVNINYNEICEWLSDPPVHEYIYSIGGLLTFIYLCDGLIIVLG